jgi:hypothetical protein
VNGIILCVVLAASGLTNQPEASRKPACKAAIRGQFWPVAANSDSGAARKLSQCGALELCTATVWRYKWQPVAVNVRQLGKTPQQPTPACAALLEEYGERGQ